MLPARSKSDATALQSTDQRSAIAHAKLQRGVPRPPGNVRRLGTEVAAKRGRVHHPDVATHLNNLAQLLQSAGRLKEAEPTVQRALKIDEAVYGPNHPEVATDLNNLGGLLCATDRRAEAEPIMQRALKIDEAAYGPNHPEVARDLNNLAHLLHDTNRLNDAEPLAPVPSVAVTVKAPAVPAAKVVPAALVRSGAWRRTVSVNCCVAAVATPLPAVRVSG